MCRRDPETRRAGRSTEDADPVSAMAITRMLRSWSVHAVLVRAGEGPPQTPVVAELDIEGELAEITLSQRPTITARLAVEPVAQIRASMGRC